MKHSESSLLAIVLVCLWVTIVPFRGAQADHPAAEDAFETLQKTQRVYDRAVGEAGTKSREYAAFEVLLRQSSARQYAHRLLYSAQPAARLYGIILLLEIDPAAAECEMARLEEESTVVEVQAGCLVLRNTVGYYARQLRAGKFLIVTPRVIEFYKHQVPSR